MDRPADVRIIALTTAYPQLRAIRLATGEWGKSDNACWA